jgi:hypothetical protein
MLNLTPTPLSKTFSYDPIGNLLSESYGDIAYNSQGIALRNRSGRAGDGRTT